MRSRLELTRAQILTHRQLAGTLDRRLPAGSEGLRRAAWAGLQDSVPRSAQLSIHARVENPGTAAWEDPSLVQLWGPRFTAYVVPASDRAVFSLGRLPDNAGRRQFAENLANRLHHFLDGRTMTYGEAGHGIGVHPNQLRYAAATGRVLIRWEGARLPVVWTVQAPKIDPREARLELARRYLHLFGPTTPAAFTKWAGIESAGGRAAFAALDGSLTPVRSTLGEGWILSGDEEKFRSPADLAPARLLPSGDAYFLLQGPDRELLVPDASDRARLWTPRVWPGAVLAGGEVVGTWRREQAHVTIEAWHALSQADRHAVESEATSMPLPALSGPIRVHWSD
jgi:hypothetical protein